VLIRDGYEVLLNIFWNKLCEVEKLAYQ